MPKQSAESLQLSKIPSEQQRPGNFFSFGVVLKASYTPNTNAQCSMGHRT